MGIICDAITVGARNSPLSQIQVQEVLEELRGYYPSINFNPVFLASTGDKDLKTSLRSLDKTDFFTREIDELLLNGRCRIGIHSAKDLPEPLPKGLVLAALTQGIDPADVLVLRPNESLHSLPSGAVIATSSERREQAVRQLRPDLQFVDLRGTIGQRLEKLDSGEADGVVVAEAALIRLGLTHLNRIVIPGETAPFQGQLAMIAREDDHAAISLFRCIDSRGSAAPTVLYLGLHLPERRDVHFVHYPIIKIIPRPFEEPLIQKVYRQLPEFTHLVFTSQSAVAIFFEFLPLLGHSLDRIKKMRVIAVGKATAKKIEGYGIRVQTCSEEECAEGIVAKLESMDLKQARILWSHSALSRTVLTDYFIHKQISFESCVLYDTLPNRDFPKPNLEKIDEIMFTSPSCIEAFIEIMGELPVGKRLACQGPITKQVLDNLCCFRN